MTYFQILTILINPVILFLVVFFLRLRFKLRSYSFIFLAVGLGLSGGGLFVGIQFLTNTLSIVEVLNVFSILLISFFLIGISTGLILYGIMRLVFYKISHFGGPFEGILYATIVSLSFASVVLLLIPPEKFDTIAGMLFGLTYPIASILTAVILGYSLGMAKSGKYSLRDNILAITFSSLFSGLYIFCILINAFTLLSIVGVISLFIALLLTYKSINIADKVAN